MMKTLNISTSMLFILILFTAISCKDVKDEPTDQKRAQVNPNKADQNEKEAEKMIAKIAFKNTETTQAFQHYIHLKTALVNSNTEEAKNAARMLAEVFETDHEIKETARAIATDEGLEKQRESFLTLSTQLESIFKASLTSGEIYKQYCPMAFNNAGGYWFSEHKEIRNPYFGDQMLKCGSVKETFR